MPTPYTQLLSGTQELVSTLACFASAGEIKARTPLMQNGAGLMVEWDGTPGKAVYLTISDINTATKTAHRFISAGFLISMKLTGLIQRTRSRKKCRLLLVPVFPYSL